jgi:hypothetical protein
LLPCRYPPACRTELPVCLITTRFTDSRAFDAVAWIPRAAMDALFTSQSPLPGCPGLRAAEPIHSASFTDFEASIPSRIRSRPVRVAPSWRPILFWVLPSSLECSPSTPRVLDPPRPRGPEHVPPSEDFGPATPGTSSPKNRVKPSWIQKHQEDVVDSTSPLRTGPDRLVGGHRSSPGLSPPSKPGAHDLRSFGVRGQRHLSRRSAYSSEVLCLLTSLVALIPLQSWLIASPGT